MTQKYIFTQSQELVSYESAVAALDLQECELLYGRAGYLYALLYARHAAGGAAADPDSAARLADEARHIAAQIIETGDCFPNCSVLLKQIHNQDNVGQRRCKT